MSGGRRRRPIRNESDSCVQKKQNLCMHEAKQNQIVLPDLDFKIMLEILKQYCNCDYLYVTHVTYNYRC